MKKVMFIIILILLGIIGFLLFRKGNSVKTSQTETPSKSEVKEEPQPIVSKKPILKGEEKKFIKEGTDYMDINVEYPKFDNEKVSAKILDFINAEIAEFKINNDISKMSQADKDFIFQNKVKYTFNTEYKVYEADTISSVVFDISDYTGGAHGGLVVKSLNFDQSGETLSIGDLFKSESQYLTKLSQLSKDKLKEAVGENGTWIADGTKPVTDNFRTFYIKGSSLYIIFQPYQVAPWVNGTPEINISKDELGDILNSNILD